MKLGTLRQQTSFTYAFSSSGLHKTLVAPLRALKHILFCSISMLRGFNLGSFWASRLKSALEYKRDRRQVTRSKYASKEGWKRHSSQKHLVPGWNFNTRNTGVVLNGAANERLLSPSEASILLLALDRYSPSFNGSKTTTNRLHPSYPGSIYRDLPWGFQESPAPRRFGPNWTHKHGHKIMEDR